MFTLFFVVNIYDLIVLDGGIFGRSKKLRIAGTEDMEKAVGGEPVYLTKNGYGVMVVLSLEA